MALPPIVTEAMQTSIDANRRNAEQSQAFAAEVRKFSSGIGEMSAASMALSQFAKRDKKIKNPFKSIKESFDKTAFGQARIQKREEESLASKIGITREELLMLKAQKELTDSQEAVAESFRANAAEYGINLENISTSFNDVGQMLLKNDKEEAAELKDLLGQGNLDFINELRDLKDPQLSDEEQLLLNQIAETIRVSGQASAEQLEQLVSSDSESATYLQNMARNLASGGVGDIENAREQGRRDEKTAAIFEDIRDNLTSLEKSLIDGFGDLLDLAAEKASKGIGLGLGLLLAPIALASGMLKGFTDSVKQLARTVKLFLRVSIVKPLQALGRMFIKIGNAIAPKKMEAAAKAISNFTTKTASFFKRLVTPLKNASKAFKAGLNGLNVFRTATGQFGKLGFFGKIGKGINTIKTFLTPVAEFFKSIGSKVKTAFSGVSKIGGFLSGIGSTMKPILKVASAIGRVIGRAFYPITILMSVFDAVGGFIKGFKANGIIGGLTGAWFGIIDGLVMKFLDLIKSLVSWVAEKLGFTGISKALDSFSFSDIWQGIGDKVQEAISWIKNFFGNLVASGIKGIKRFFGFGGDEEEEAPSNKESQRAADIRARKMKRGRMTQEEKDAENLQRIQDAKDKAAAGDNNNEYDFFEQMRQMEDSKARSDKEIAEMNRKSREQEAAKGGGSAVVVHAPQNANVNNNSQTMNQTVSIPATANPNKPRGRARGRQRYS